MLPRIYLLCIVILKAFLGQAYWLMGANNILTTQRLDPIVFPGTVSTHVHSVLGGSNFGPNITTTRLLQSECTSIPIIEDKSNYWYPVKQYQLSHLNGSLIFVILPAPVLSVAEWNFYECKWKRGDVCFKPSYPRLVERGSYYRYYLFSEEPGYTAPFSENFRMISGDPNLRTLDPSSFAQQAVTFLCLDFGGTSKRYNELPKGKCPSGIRAQINFPSCWDGKNVDSPDHKSHVAFLSTGPDNGTCSDPKFPLTLPRIFMEVYWNTGDFDAYRQEAMSPDQPFVYSNGDPTGYGYHADFFNGWEPDVLRRALNECHCNPYGDPTCCAAQGIFTIDQHTNCFITNTFDEATTGTLATLPGNNPVQVDCYEDYFDTGVPAVLAPVFVNNGTVSSPSHAATIIIPATTSKVVQTARGKCLRNIAIPSFTPRPLYVLATAVVTLLVSQGGRLEVFSRIYIRH